MKVTRSGFALLPRIIPTVRIVSSTQCTQMGNILTPNAIKETKTGTMKSGLKYGVSSMMGRRSNMEDAHLVCDLQDDPYSVPNHALFGVFDGHGGAYAAQYAASRMPSILTSQVEFHKYQQLLLGQQQQPQPQPQQPQPTTNEKSPNRSSKNSNNNKNNTKKQQTKELLTRLEEAFKDAFLELDRQLFLMVLDKREQAEQKAAALKKKIKLKDAGTTACVVLVTPDYIVCANAGDSRAMLVRANNSVSASSGNHTGKNSSSGGGGGLVVLPLSRDHKPNDEAEERRIRRAGGYVFGGRIEDDLMVSRGFGDYRHKESNITIHGICTTTGRRQHDQKVSPLPDVTCYKRLHSSDAYILIACDGIYDVRTNEEARNDIHRICAEGETNHGLICEELLDLCLQSGSKDNMSAIIIDLGNIEIGKGDGVVGRRARREAFGGPFKFFCIPK